MGKLAAKIQQKAASIEAAVKKRMPDDFLLFQRYVVIPSAFGPKRLGQCQVGFQKECFEALAPSLMAVKEGVMPPIKKFWIERTKKSSKDADLAICVLWLMAFTERPILIQICASDSKQAKIIRDRCSETLHYNPWLGELVEILDNQIRNVKRPKTVRTDIEATGTAGSAQGPTPDVLNLNELVHVERWATIQAHLANAAGVPRNVTIISTNAGIYGTPSHKMREDVIAEEGASIHIWDKPAPWISQKDIDLIKSTDPTGKESDRLFYGKWISGFGDALTEGDVASIFCLDGPSLVTEPGWFYLMGLDMGETHDHAGLVILGVDPVSTLIKVCRFRSFAPTKPNAQGKNEVDVEQVQTVALRWFREFGCCWFGYDPAAGGRFVAQWLRKYGVPTSEMGFASPKNRTDMATSFVQAVLDRRLQSYDDEDGTLRRDISKFSIERRMSGIRLTAVSDQYGHADVGTALVICLPQAFQFFGWLSTFDVDQPIADSDPKPFTEEELEEMDPLLRGLYDLDWDNEKKEAEE